MPTRSQGIGSNVTNNIADELPNNVVKLKATIKKLTRDLEIAQEEHGRTEGERVELVARLVS